MSSISIRHLTARLNQINEVTGNPLEAWTGQTDGTFKANIGTYVLDWAYGGVRLSQISSEGGGERDITGRATKRETYERMGAFLAGLQAGVLRF